MPDAVPTLYDDPMMYNDMYATPSPEATLLSNMITLAIIVIMVVAMAKIFMKAGKEWWKALIPIYNTYVLLEIIKKPWWWLILVFIPFVNIVMWVLIAYNLAKAFGHGFLFTLGLIFLPFIFYLILGFGGSKYLYAEPGKVNPEKVEEAKEKTQEVAQAQESTQPQG